MKPVQRSNSKSDNLLQIHTKSEDDSDDEIPLIKHIKKKLITPKPSPKNSPKPSPKNSPKHSPRHISKPIEKKDPIATKPKEPVVTNLTKDPVKETRVIKKRITPDNQLILENRAYYKVEVLSSKLRSSSTVVTNDVKVKEPVIKEEKVVRTSDDKSLVVKFKRIRKSELSTLSDEAENFMFPRKDDSSNEQEDLDTDEERNTTQESLVNRSSDSIKSSDGQTPHIDDSSQDCNESILSSCESTKSDSSKHKKRRTHAELFIDDNERYYKFETPGSRLRFQGSFLPLITTPTTPLTHKPAVKPESKVKKELGIKRETDDVEKSLAKYKTLPSINKLSFTYERITKKDVKLITKFERKQIERDFDLFCGLNCPKFVPHILPFERKTLVIQKDPKSCKEEFLKRLESVPPPAPPSSDRTNFSEANSVIDSSDQVDQLSNSSSKMSSDRHSGEIKERKRKQKRYDSTDGK